MGKVTKKKKRAALQGIAGSCWPNTEMAAVMKTTDTDKQQGGKEQEWIFQLEQENKAWERSFK